MQEMYPMRNSALYLILTLMMVAFGFAQNYPSFPVGQYWQFPDARSLALGGAGSVSLDAPTAMFYNPAALTGIDHSVKGNVSLNLRKLEERRAYPLYDRFDGVTARGIYAINNNWYLRPEGTVAAAVPQSFLPGLTVAAGSFTEIDQNYQYLEEVRENEFGDALLAYNRIEFDGALQRYGLALAAPLPVLPDLSLGFQAGMLDGHLDYVREVNFVNGNQNDILQRVHRTLDNTPLVLSLGGVYRANERLTAGADVVLPYTVKYRAAGAEGVVLNEEIQYPLKLNGGFEYRARQELQARLNVDVGYEFWSQADYSSEIGGVVSTTQEFVDVFVIKAGIEHIFYNKIPFRVGMQYRNSYQTRGNTRTLLSAGTGFFGNNWKVDVAGAYSQYSYRYADLFNDEIYGGTRVPRNQKDDVDEYNLFGRISLTFFLDY